MTKWVGSRQILESWYLCKADQKPPSFTLEKEEKGQEKEKEERQEEEKGEFVSAEVLYF